MYQLMSSSQLLSGSSVDDGVGGVQPQPLLPKPNMNVEEMSSALERCIKVGDGTDASMMHAHIRNHGLEGHHLLGNQLVSMLVNVGNLKDAHTVFDKLTHKKERSWNSLMSGYVGCGEPGLALSLYEKMKAEDESLYPSPHSCAALLKACAQLKDVQRGSRIHADVEKKGLLRRFVVVGNAVINMYTKCHLLEKALEVFEKLPVQNVVSWNTLITGYVKDGFDEEALTCFYLMQRKGVSPNSVTFICSLKACGNMGEMEKAQHIHGEIARIGLLETDVFVGTALVDMYIKAGFLAKAQEVFDKLPAPNVVSWNALIGGYAEYGHGDKAIHLFEEMQLKGVSPDAVTFICTLKACGSIGAIAKGEEIHAQVSKTGLLKKDYIVGGALVNMYAKCGLFSRAREVLDMLPRRDVVSWTALISGYADQGHGGEALNCFQEMQVEGVLPNNITLVSSLKACGSIGAADKGKEIHAEIIRKGLLKRDPTLGSALVDMYVKCGLCLQAQHVFDEISARNVISWNTLITGYVQYGMADSVFNCYEQMLSEGISPDEVTFLCCLKACASLGNIEKGQKVHVQIARKGFLDDYPGTGNALVDMYAKCGLLEQAREVFDELPTRDIVSWNALVAGYAQHEYGEEALQCVEEMQMLGICPDVITLVCSLKACGTIGASMKGREIHIEMELLERDPVLGNALIDMYAKCGSLDKAEHVFHKLLVQDLVSWTSLIAGYAQKGESRNVFRTFDKMIRDDIKPNVVTFINVLNACSHSGLVAEGQACLEVMSRDYGITPTSEHHTCMVDLLCRAGQIEEAVRVIEEMKFLLLVPDVVLWHTVLGACQKWQANVEIARHAFEHALHLDHCNSATYVSMSNIYVADRGNVIHDNYAKKLGNEVQKA